RELRQEAIARFATAMDFPPEVLGGTGGSNHWSAWHIEESAVKIHIEPLMTRICDALTEAYLKPALKHLKEDETRYIFWYDTAPLTVRRERLKDTLNMYEKGLVSADAVRLAGDYAISDAPTDEESMKRFTQELMLRSPASLIQSVDLRKVAGYTDDILPATAVVAPAAGTPGAGPPPPPAPPTGIQPTGPAPLPQGSVAEGAPPVVEGPGMVAAVSVPTAYTTFAIGNAVAVRAFEVAGKRLLTRGVRKEVH